MQRHVETAAARLIHHDVERAVPIHLPYGAWSISAAADLVADLNFEAFRKGWTHRRGFRGLRTQSIRRGLHSV